MTELQMWTTHLRVVAGLLLATGRDRGERGASEVATVVILTAIIAAGAITIGGILVAKFTGAANSVPTGP